MIKLIKRSKIKIKRPSKTRLLIRITNSIRLWIRIRKFQIRNRLKSLISRKFKITIISKPITTMKTTTMRKIFLIIIMQSCHGILLKKSRTGF